MQWKTLTLVIVLSVMLTTLGIGASDTLRGVSGGLVAQIIGSKPDVCPADMVAVPTALSFTCVDRFEASPSATCVYQTPNSVVETTANLEDADCNAVAVTGVVPWRFIAREAAAAMCARSGKRLPTALEWYSSAVGSDATVCNLTSTLLYPTGKDARCTTPAGALDVVGNVWEWVSDDVIDGQYNGRTMPSSGYVMQVDNGGIATETNGTEANEQLGSDYVWSDSNGAFGMIRGGFYGSKSDGGVYAVQATTKPSFSGAAIGFRCVR